MATTASSSAAANSSAPPTTPPSAAAPGPTPPPFSGDAGTNTLTLDDHNDATGRTWNIGPTSVTPVGISTISLSSFEAMAMLGGNGNDAINVNGAFGIGLTVDGGNGADSISLGNVSATTFGPDVSMNGGDGEDSFLIANVSTPSFTTSVSLNGNNGLN